MGRTTRFQFMSREAAERAQQGFLDPKGRSPARISAGSHRSHVGTGYAAAAGGGLR